MQTLDDSIINKKNISFLAILPILPISVAFFFLLYKKVIGFDYIVVFLISLVLIFSLRDKRFTVIGWLLLAPYFYSTGIAGNLNIPANLTHNFYLPLTFILITLSSKKKIITRPIIFWIIFIFYALFLSLLFDVDYQIFRSLFMLYIMPLFVYFIIINIKPDRKFLYFTSYALIFHLITLSLISFFEYTTGKSIYTSELIWKDIGNGRIAGPFLNPVVFGLFIIFVFIFLTISFKKNMIQPSVYFFCVALSSTLIFLTFTRSIWISFLLVIFYIIYNFNKSNKSNFLFYSIFLIGIIFYLYSAFFQSGELSDRLNNAQNITFRQQVAEFSSELFFNSPIVGSGFGSFDNKLKDLMTEKGLSTKKFTTSHITILTILVELGIIGAFLFILPFIIFLKEKSDKEPTNSMIKTCVMAFILAFVLNSFSIDFRFTPIVYSLLFFSLGIFQNNPLHQDQLKELTSS